MTATEAKDTAYGLDAELCGIAAVGRFKDSPERFHPRDIHKGCKSVMAFAKVIPRPVFGIVKK